MSASVSLPIVTGGVGAAVPTPVHGALKTIVATGVDGVIDIEASGDGVNFINVASFSAGQTEQIISLVCAAMRVNATNGSANSVAVMAEETLCKFGIVPAPPTNGPGAALDVSDFGFLTSVLVTQPSGGGTIEIQISEDGVNWTTAYQSVAYAKLLDAPALSANFIRAVGNQATALSITVCSAVLPLALSMITQGLFVFRPEDPLGQRQNVFTSWTDLMAALDASREFGFRVVEFDFGFTGGDFDVPPGTWDFTDVKWTDTMRRGNGGLFAFTGGIYLGDDVIIENLAFIEMNATDVICISETTVPMTFNEVWHTICLGGSQTNLYSLTSVPLIRLGATFCPPISPENPDGAFFLYESSFLGVAGLSTLGTAYAGFDYGTPAVDLMGRGVGLVCNWERNAFVNSCPYPSGAYIESINSIPSFGAGSFGDAFSSPNTQGNNYDLSATLDMSLVTFNVARYAYATGWQTAPDRGMPITPARWPDGFFPPYGAVTNCDPTAGPVDVYLEGAYPNFGAQYLIADSVGSCGPGNEIRIHAKGGELINGVNPYVIDTPRGAAMLVSVPEGPGVWEPVKGDPVGTYPIKNTVVGQWIVLRSN